MKKKRTVVPRLGTLIRGFTLIEVLVAMAITGMLVSILMSSLFYIFRVQDGVQAELEEREYLLRGKAWFRTALGGCLPLKEGEAGVFLGEKQEIRCETSTPIIPAKLTMPLEAMFSIVREKEQIRLEYKETHAEPARQVVLHQWLGDEAYFEFVNAQGEVVDRWPTGVPEEGALPRQVRLVVRERGEPQVFWLVALRSDPWLPEQPKLPFDADPDLFR